MSSLNRVTLIGHLGRDPEIRTTKDGKQIASFSVATSETWKDKTTGEKKEATEWHKVVVFQEGLVKILQSYARKGSKLFIEGQNKTRKYTDKNGAERYTTEIVLSGLTGQIILLDSKGGGNAPPPASEEEYGDYNSKSQPSVDGLDDEIPF